MSISEGPARVFVKILDRMKLKLEAYDPDFGPLGIEKPSALRTDFFALEEWARVHENWESKKKKKLFEKIFEKAKEIEDVLGLVDLQQALLKEAKEKKAPKKLVDFLKFELKNALETAQKTLSDEKWIHPEQRRVEKLKEELADRLWPEEDVHVQFIAQQLVKTIKAFGEKYEKELKPLMTRPVYNYEALEYGVHEFRRDIREWAIVFQASDGLLGLAPLPRQMSAETRELVESLKDNPFSKLVSHRHTKVRLDPIAYKRMTRLITELGLVKDMGEKYFKMLEALVDSETVGSKSEARKILQDWYGQQPKILSEKVAEILKEFEAHRIDQQFILDLQSAIGK